MQLGPMIKKLSGLLFGPTCIFLTASSRDVITRANISIVDVLHICINYTKYAAVCVVTVVGRLLLYADGNATACQQVIIVVGGKLIRGAKLFYFSSLPHLLPFLVAVSFSHFFCQMSGVILDNCCRKKCLTWKLSVS